MLSWQKRRINCEEEEMYYQKSSCFSKTKLWTKANNCNEIEYNYAKILLENIKEACTQFFKGKTFAAFKNSDSVSESWTLPSLIKKIKGFENKTIEKSFIHKNFPVANWENLFKVRKEVLQKIWWKSLIWKIMNGQSAKK